MVGQKVRVVLALICGFFVLGGIGMMWLVSLQPTSYLIASGATILYYNAPAAVSYRGGLAVGYIDAEGVVRVSALGPRGNVTRTWDIHDHGVPDDHAAPALWLDGDRLLIATAHHSSDLFIYSLSDAGHIKLQCYYPGRFTYPRFHLRGETLSLLVRSETGVAGHLSRLNVSDGCAIPETLFEAGEREAIYATIPSRGGQVAWSLYNIDTGRHSGLWIDGVASDIRQSMLEETLAWSVADNLVAVTRFSNSFICCGLGQRVVEIYRNGAMIFETLPSATPYYPGGAVIDPTGSVALVPLGPQIDLLNLDDLTLFTGCRSAGWNTHQQFVHGRTDQYVYISTSRYEMREYASTQIRLCDLTQSGR